VGNSPCSPEIRRGRRQKAVDFLASANALGIVVNKADSSDSYVQLCILAGIAAADVICCAKLGYHSEGQDHTSAVTLLSSVDSRNLLNRLPLAARD
jgi:hypothetical protein